MKNIINQIIEIDAVAQKRLDDANKIKEQYLQELKIKSQEVNEKLEEKTKNRIQKILVTESQFADEQKSNIEKETQKVIERLEETYKTNHEKLEQDIFNNVISI